MKYDIGNEFERDGKRWIVTDVEHWEHESMGPQVTIKGRRFIKSRGCFAKNAGRITTMCLDYYNENYRG